MRRLPMDALPDDLILNFFINGYVKCEDAVAIALASRRYHSAFLTARARSFNFRILSYIYKDQLYRQEIVEEYFFRFHYIDDLSPPEERNEYVHSNVHLFEWYTFNEYDSDGNMPSLNYDSVDEKHRLPGLNCSDILVPLITSISQKVRQLDIVSVLYGKLRENFPYYAYSYSHTNVSLTMRYSRVASDHRPIYCICARFEFIYKSETYDGVKRRKPHYAEGVSLRGHFPYPYHATDEILEYFTKLSCMDTIKAGEDFIIDTTWNRELHGTSIVPVCTDLLKNPYERYWNKRA